MGWWGCAKRKELKNKCRCSLIVCAQRAHINPKTSQNENQSWVPHRTVRWGTPLRRGKKSENNIDPTKRWVPPIPVPPFCSKRWPTWPQLGSQNGAKMAKKSMQKCIIFLMPLGIDFWVDFHGFWVPKSSQVGTKMLSKIDVNFEGRKPTKR